MLHSVIKYIDKKLAFTNVSAHCDIPCKIYDPSAAQIAVLTIIRMVDLLQELESVGVMNSTSQAEFQRLIAQKEEHGKKVKQEITTIWGDYIKAPQLEAFPELHELTHSIMILSSKAKQTVNKEVSLELLVKVNRFAEIFWESKGVATYTATCPYPPLQTVIYPDLKAS
ncbi:MAG: superoxide dismutase, Ni [Psychromonas sp.]|nr:superoxide dismutase, Ni [Alteromonadales bacterium]MCP5077618.1 superoxide dismutase, Ni [Psychromonas sp.]